MAETRLKSSQLSASDRHWAEVAADAVQAQFPDEKLYTCAAGISPSGVVHFGNLRDVMTSYAVFQTLKARGLPAKFLFSWDDYDRFRKVPEGIDASFGEHIGKPLSAVPDPHGTCASYAERYEREFMESMEECGIHMEYVFQSREYQSGRYDDEIVRCMERREEIAKILLSFMSDKGKEMKGINEKEYIASYYPIAVYSRFSGKDTVKITGYDGGSIIRYRCKESGKEEEVDLREERIAKLAWKVDWPMRWNEEGVVFEPGGHDHASPGGSYDTSFDLARTIFGRKGPVFIGYEFIGLRGIGGKMSGSKGKVMSPAQLLRLFEPSLLTWLYLRRHPGQKFELAFDSETLRQYAEFDRDVAGYASLPAPAQTSVRLSCGGDPASEQTQAIPFRLAASLGQIVQWDEERLQDVLGRMELQYSPQSIHARLPRARHWIEEYNPEQAIRLLPGVNAAYAEAMSADAKAQISALRQELLAHPGLSLQELEALTYRIPKDESRDDAENRKCQRAFFADAYNLLIGKDTGPRLGTFLAVIDREQVLALLDVG